MSIHPVDDEGEELLGRGPDPAAERDLHGTADDEARHWLAHVYQGDRVRQLSVRSIITGS